MDINKVKTEVIDSSAFKVSLKDRIKSKMGIVKWFNELYYQVAEAVVKDSRYKTLPQSCQNTAVTTVFIASKQALDEGRKESSDWLKSKRKDQ